jgi:ABC-2 type transport system permease protein
VRESIMTQAGAILWAQWRTLYNFYPRRGVAWTAVVGVIWYGLWTVAAIAFLRVFSNPDELPVIRIALPGGLLLLFLYWQVVPLLLATTGSSLDLRKLRSYPIPENQLFSIEVLLRITAGIEVVLLLAGCTIGALLNPALPKWSLLAAVLYITFNLVIAVGLRDLLSRLLARKRIRELVFFLVILSAALPQLILARRGMVSPQLRLLIARDSWAGWPWTASAHLLLGTQVALSIAVLLAWTLAALAFSRWQFSRTLSFDAEAANAQASRGAKRGFMEGFYRLPSAVLRDPLGALVEKEFRFLVRAPRFRLVFLMGFTFGLVIWLPMVFVPRGPLGGFFYQNYLTVVSVYSLMLMSEVCFWNSFGFDRSAAQFYFLAPVSFARVLVGKNLTAAFFMLLEISMVTLVCVLLRMPLDARRLAEAYGVAGVAMILLFSAGNLLSVHQARGVNPGNSFRTGAAGRLQAMLFAVYPVTFAPIALAYLARYAFNSQIALYVVLATDAAAGLIFYRVTLESAVQAADRVKEKMVAALSAGDGPIAD